jgi:RNA polymerase sigma-70 factor (ECF subfamily)
MTLGKKLSGAAVSSREHGISALTLAMARGDEDAFREFHACYFDRLLRYLFVVTRGDEETARDALQETFARVARHVRVFDSEEKFWSWLTVLARSAAMDAGRKHMRYWQLLARYALFWKTVEEQPVTDTFHLDEMLSAAMDALNVVDRALVDGKYFRGLDVRALAHEFALTEKAVESRLTRARRELREEITKRLRNEH